MASLASLPPELLASIVAWLPLHSDSARPHQGAWALSVSSRTLHSVLSPHLNHAVHLRTVLQARLFLEAAHSIAQDVKRLHFHRLPPVDVPTEDGDNDRRWPTELVVEILSLTPLALTELELKVDLTTVWQQSPFATAQSSSLSGVKRLSVDVGQEGPTDSSTRTRPGTSVDPHSLLESSLALPALESLRVAHLWASACLQPFESHVQHLDFSACHLPDATLLSLSQHVRVRSLKLDRCTGFSADSLVQALGFAGPCLERLELVMSPCHRSSTSSTSRTAPSPPRTPPRHSSPRPSNIPSSPPRSPPPSTPWPFASVIDHCVLHLHSLRHLSLTGLLASPALPALLRSSTPHLSHLAIVDCPSITSRSLLPLLHHLPLTHLTLSPPKRTSLPSEEGPEDLPSTAEQHMDALAIQELWGIAMDKGVCIEGTAFEQVERRVGWAVEMALNAVQEVGRGEEAVQVRKRKKPGLRA